MAHGWCFICARAGGVLASSARGVVGLALLIATVASGCGGKSASQTPGSGGVSGSGGGGGGSSGADAMGGAGASGALAEPATGGGAGEIGDGAAAGVAGADEATAGSSAMAGASVTAGDGGATGGADSGGLGGSGTGGGEVATGPRAPGFSCGGAWCDIGRRCVLCTDHNRCVPDAERDPGGYAEEMTGCELSLPSWVECDGHEDCPSGEFCVSNRNGLICTAAADLPAVQSCCPICLVITSCIRCWSDTDCPEGSLCNQPITDPYGCGLPE